MVFRDNVFRLSGLLILTAQYVSEFSHNEKIASWLAKVTDLHIATPLSFISSWMSEVFLE